jgi:hypothetical protein
MTMRGQEVFRKAVRVTVESATKSLERAKVSAAEIALFVPHQANVRIMDAVAERLGIPADRVASVIEHTGNTSSASIPIALTDAANAGRLARRRPGAARRVRRRHDLGVSRVALGRRSGSVRASSYEPRGTPTAPTRL